MFENPRRDRQARNFPTNVPKILDLKSSSEQIFSENCRWVPLIHDIISLHCFVLLNPLLRRRFFAVVLAGVRTGGIAREKEDCQQSKSG